MEFICEDERIYAQDDSGKLLAEVTFPIKDGVAKIDHTFVDDSLRGQGTAGKLLTAAAEQLRTAGLKAYPTCPYAEKWFATHTEYADLLTAP